MNTYVIKTLGCKANLYDSQLIEAELRKRGWQPAEESLSNASRTVCIVNSCTVTDEADRQTRRLASKLSRENPRAEVIVTGCAAEVDPERLARSKGIHYVIGNRDKTRLVDLIESIKREQGDTASATGEVLGTARSWEELRSRHAEDREWTEPESAFLTPIEATSSGMDTLKTRAFLKIQEGCNAFCTYCIIPYGRGPSRSLKPGRVIEQVRELVENGVREVVLTGTNIGDYGMDWGEDAGFAALVKAILRETELERLRLSSLDPVEITPELLEAMAVDRRLCPHFHVSLQSPLTRILKVMKRKYATEDVVRTLRAIQDLPRSPFVGMDVITGFPGESDSDFEESIALLRELPWTRLHVFPYSEREGTPATRLSGVVPRGERLERSRKLNRLSLERLKAHHEAVLSSGELLEGVLFERQSKDGSALGYTPNYLRTKATSFGDKPLYNQIATVIPESIEIDEANADCVILGKIGQAPIS